MKLRLVTLNGTKLDEEVYEAILPTADGEISVFTDHEPVVTLERALKLQEAATNQVELEKAHQLVDRHMVRLKVADMHRRHRRQ